MKYNKMNSKNKILISIFTFVIIGFIPIAFIFAQDDSFQQLQETINQLKEQINQLQAQIRELKSQPVPTITKSIFSQTLNKGSGGDEVTKLQKYLAQFPDIYPEGLVTGYFGSLTEAAVKRFQEKYAEDILSPLGLATGTGFVGEVTIAKLNELTAEAIKEEIPAKEEVIKEKAVIEEVVTTTPEVAATTPSEIAAITEEAADITPPADVTNLTAVVDVGSAAFSWANPADKDFAGTKIIKKWWSEPRDIYDGAQIYDGPATSTTEYGLMTGIMYYYKVFTYDEVPNYSSGTVLKFTSTSSASIVVTSTATPAAASTGGITAGGAAIADTTPPVISNFQPSGTTTDPTPTFHLSTNEAATCRLTNIANQSFNDITLGGFASVLGGTYHYNTLGPMATGTYSYYARCQDTAGNQNTTSASTTFTITAGIADTAAPVISNVQTSKITASSTLIIWQTNEESDNMINYGLTASYGSTASIEAGVVYHEVKLSNLASNTTYHYKVISTDSSGNKAETQDKTFTTLVLDATSPVISDIQTSNITQTSATITWTTNEPADSKVSYSLTSPITSPTILTDPSNVTSHTINLTNLASNTTYYYTVASADASNNPAVSTEQSFTTLSSPSSSASNYSIDLENSAADNQYLFIKDNQQSGLDLASGRFTIEAWVKLESTSWQVVTIVSKNRQKTPSLQAYVFYWHPKELGITVSAQIGEKEGNWYSSYPQVMGTWTHIAVVVSLGGSDHSVFYVNGNKLTKTTMTSSVSGSINTSPTNVTLGANKEGSSDFVDGKIDEVRVWNIERTEAEIQQNYNKELVGNESGLVGYWQFNNELVNGKAKDETSNHNDLTLNNNPAFSTDTPF